MTPSQPRALCLLLAMLPLTATAAGFGELMVSSSIGEALRGEVRLFGYPEEELEPRCFSLQDSRHPDLPPLLDAVILLENRGGQWFLLLRGSRPINEPLLSLRLQAACGSALARDFVVMPLPPRPEQTSTLDSASDKLPARRQASASNRLATTTPSQPARTTTETPPRQPAPAAVKPRPAARPAIAEPASPGDRLVLGAAPLTENTTQALLDRRQGEERLLRMETSLQQLQASLAALESALQLEAEARPLRQELQLAQALQQLPAAEPPDATTAWQDWQRWLELLVGSVCGGALSASLLHWLEKRRRHRRPAG